MLKDQLQEVEKRIQAACDRAGRKREEVTLIAVSKTKPVETLQEAYDLGVRIFGENKVQELTAKYEALPKDIHWHMIGHLQTNKVKYIIDKAELIHSVDSLKLAETIEKEAAKHDLIADILVEVNVAEEENGRSDSVCGKSVRISSCTGKRSDDDCSICRRPRGKSQYFCRFT